MAIAYGFWRAGIVGSSTNMNMAMLATADATTDLPAAATTNAGMMAFVSSSQLMMMSNGISWQVVGIACDGTPAQGDLFYANSTSKITRLPAGTVGLFLQTQGSTANPTWASSYYNTQTRYTPTTSPSRNLETVYQNTTGQAMVINAYCQWTSTAALVGQTDSTNPPTTTVAQMTLTGASYLSDGTMTLVVLPNNYYQLNIVPGSTAIALLGWIEWH